MQPPDESNAITLKRLLKMMVERGASDLHITTASPPQLRIDGALVPLKTPPLRPEDTKRLCYEVLSEDQKIKFENSNEIDFSFGVKGLARFRANVFLQRGAVAGAFRMIPFRIRSLPELGLPSVVQDLSQLPQGLVLVTGPTGSGKSTTLAAIIDRINNERRQHIITIEDPIEYLHPNKNCVVNQREIGMDTESFKGALKYVLRQDPDVVLVGEMRDLETIQAALTISETGHLVFATLHTNSTVQTINRIIDVFPPNQQEQVRTQLSFVLQGVVTQALLPRGDGPGRVAACEIMLPNIAIRNLIREQKIHQIYGLMQAGQGTSRMQTMNQSLHALYSYRYITLEEALGRSVDPGELHLMIEGRHPIPEGILPLAELRGKGPRPQ